MAYFPGCYKPSILALAALALAAGCSGWGNESPFPSGESGAPVAAGGAEPVAGSASGGAGAGGMAAGGGGTSSGGDGTPSGVNLNGRPGHYRFVRLTHAQWEASVRDLLSLGALPGLSGGFAADPPNGVFTNNERSLFVSSTLWGDYQRAAEALAAKVAGDAALVSKVTGGTTDSGEFIRSFGRRTFRRPLTSGEQTLFKKLFEQGPTLVGSGNAFKDGVRLVIEAMLQSPQFIYRSELGSDAAPLTGYEMASKLAFLLRDTTPDDALLDAAAVGEFDSPAGVLAKAATMIEEPAAQAVLGRYHRELFGLARYSTIDKSRTRFPAYTEALNAEFEQADRRFFDRIFSSGQGLREILTSPVAFVSSATAALYGTTVSGSGLVEMQLGPERPGILTRLGYLAYNANLSEPDPIHRGVDIINRLMCLDLLPPANVAIPPLPPAKPGQTNRQRVSAHTGDGTCGQGCHSVLINPLGFAFENFDALGQIRARDNDQPVDTTGQLNVAGSFKSFSGAADLVRLLAEAPNVHGCYVKHLAEFTLARDMSASDRSLVDGIERISMKSSASVKAIVLSIVGHPSFFTRNGGAP